MLAHTFTGTSIRSVLGLEPEERSFERFRASRRDERERLASSLDEREIGSLEEEAAVYGFQ
jgi:hypothetical protein